MDSATAKDRIVRAITQISRSPAAVVGLGVAQGRQKIQQELDEDAMGFVPQAKEGWPTAEQLITSIHTYLDKLDIWLLPNHLPDDYRLFIDYYGGLHIHHRGVLYLSIYGFGQGAEYQYGIPMGGDDSHYENGLLVVGTLNLHLKHHAYYNRSIYFVSDLAGRVQQGGVLALPSADWKRHPAIRDVDDVLRDLETYRDCWMKIADSFTEWLEAVARTGGTLGYIPAPDP